MNNTPVIKRLEPVFSKIETEIRRQMHSEVPLVNDVSRHLVLAGGKRLRPTLFVLTSHLCGYNGGKEYVVSCAFEYLHAATLLHDDVIDEAETRRGKPAAHTVFGTQTTVLVGDYLFAKSMALGALTGDIFFTETMSTTVGLMAEGEVLQLINSGNPDITEEEYERVIYRKTASLLESICHLGAVLAGAPREKCLALKEFGRQIGLAFQMIDDNLDYQTTAAEFGKPVGHDLDEGKITLPLIRTLKQADGKDRAELLKLVSQTERTPEEFCRIKTLIDKYGGLEQAAEKAKVAVETAKKCLEVMDSRPECQDLADLADFIVSRRK